MQAYFEAQQKGLGPLNWLGNAWIEAFGDVGSELASFIAARIGEDVKTQHRMMHCKSASELREIQAEFVQTAIEQYTAETGKLVELNQTFLQRLKEGKAD